MRIRKGNRRRIRAERHREMRASIDWIFDLRRPAVCLYPVFRLPILSPREKRARAQRNKRMSKINAELSRRAKAMGHAPLFDFADLRSAPSEIKSVRMLCRLPRRG